MANAKNTIQNIPLVGNLNLNTLKTDVSQFQGFNNKNSTVFGGELSPLYKSYNDFGKQFDSDKYLPLCNEKGDMFFLTFEGNTWEYPKGIIKDQNNNEVFRGTMSLHTINKIDVPINTLWATQFYTNFGLMQIYITETKLYWKAVQDPHQNSSSFIPNNITVDYVVNPKKYLDAVPYNEIAGSFSALKNARSVVAQCYQNDDEELRINIVYLARKSTIASSTSSVNFISLLFEKDYNNNIILNSSNFQEKTINRDVSATSAISITQDKIYFLSDTGRLTTAPTIYEASYDRSTGLFTSDFATTTTYNVAYPYTHNMIDFGFPQDGLFHSGMTANFSDFTVWGGESVQSRTYMVTPYFMEKCNFIRPDYDCAALYSLYRGNYRINDDAWATGHSGGYIPHYVNIFGNNMHPNESPIGDGAQDSFLSFSMIENNIVDFNFCGVPVIQPNTNGFDPNSLTFTGDNMNVGYSYKVNDEWFSFTGIVQLNSYEGDITQLLKNCVVDNYYVMFMSGVWTKSQPTLDKNVIFDINNGHIIEGLNYLGYVPEAIPIDIMNLLDHNQVLNTTTGTVASGYNAGYENNQENPFIGYLANPSVMTHLPVSVDLFVPYPFGFYSNNEQVLLYFTKSNSYAAAKYYGTNPKYQNTVFPIAQFGNIIYPYNLSAKVVHGYYNNDTIQIGDSAFPMIYYNNNTLKYGYFALSNIYGIGGLFTLQTQYYAYDADNIYSITFENGIISNVTTISYKENLQYVGSLPTRAIFYSEYNKAFYQFTGAAILSKMFDASDIGEIYEVQQNPATLSIWIKTNKGIFIISDIDMYKLPYTDTSLFRFFNNCSMFVMNQEFEEIVDNQKVKTNKIVSEKLSFYEIEPDSEVIPIKFSTKFYGLGSEQKANYDCWYFRLHADDRRAGYLDIKIHTITNISKETENKRFIISAADYDENNIVYLKYQPKYQSAVAMQIEGETNLAIYQISLGVNASDAVAQMSKNNF
jgi:hypothetical protein